MMTNKPNTGGAAFPSNMPPMYKVSKDQPTEIVPDGMTLRDWFAGMALQGMMSGNIVKKDKLLYEKLALYAYEQADEMIAEREK